MYTPVGHTATQQAGSGGLTATEHRLGNGLRLVLSEDHLTPVAAVCLWYDVGSRHEVKGRTGLAHLFEHLMFQGSAQVQGNGHFELVQGAGGSLNGTTSFERTNYFETMPAHQLELALWLEADRMGSLLAALDEESLENQRDVVKNERRQRYDNVPYGTAFERMTALAYPEGHPYHHTPDRLHGRSGRGDAGRRARVLPRELRAEQRGPGGRRRHRPGADAGDGSRSTSAPSRPTTARCRPATARSPTSSARNSGWRSGRRSRPAR